MKFRKIPVEVEATRWWTNGDHPDDGPAGTEGRVVRYFSTPDLPGHMPCRDCGVGMFIHGWIDTPGYGRIVCPGDWVVTEVPGEHYPLKDDFFRRAYEPVKEDL